MGIGILFGALIQWPLRALLPAALFAVLYVRARRLPILIAALAWTADFPYEQAMKLRILCSGECNIRVDLLLFYPLLALAAALAASPYSKAKGGAQRA